MRLLDKPYSKQEKDIELDMLKGNIARICVSEDPEEIVQSLGFASSRLAMIAYSRIKELKEKAGTQPVSNEHTAASHGTWIFKENERMSWITDAVCGTCNKIISSNRHLGLKEFQEEYRNENHFCPKCGSKMH